MSEKRRDNKGRILKTGEAQRPDGKYMYRYVDKSGNRQTVYSWKLVETDKIPSGKRCVASLRDLEKQIQKDIDDDIRTVEASTTTVNDLFRLFMDIRKDLRSTTRCTYLCLYDAHVKEPIGYKKIKDIKFTDIQKLCMDLVQEKNLKPSTVDKIQSLLYQVFERAVMDNMVRYNPCKGAFRSLKLSVGSDQEKRHALTEEEQQRFIEYVYKSPLYKRWGPLFTVLLGTGIRIGEALGLRWCDCDFKRNVIIIDHILLYKTTETSGYQYHIAEPKTKSGFREIPMLSDVRKTLLKYKKCRPVQQSDFTVDGYTDFIFLNNNGQVFMPSAVYDAIQRIQNDYNREEYFKAKKEHREPCYLPKFSAHNLRHTFCTRLCENESNMKIIQDVMGHKNITTTMDVYNEATAVKKAASFKDLDGKFKLF